MTKDKSWKQLCTEANPEMQESSAAGYQLRRHYQRFLLVEECRETGQDADVLVAFAESVKKKKKEKESAPGSSSGAAAVTSSGGKTSASAQQQQQQQNSASQQQQQAEAAAAAMCGSPNFHSLPQGKYFIKLK